MCFTATIFSGETNRSIRSVGPFPTMEAACRAAVMSANQIPEFDLIVRVSDGSRVVRNFLVKAT